MTHIFLMLFLSYATWTVPYEKGNPQWWSYVIHTDTGKLKVCGFVKQETAGGKYDAYVQDHKVSFDTLDKAKAKVKAGCPVTF